MENTGFKFESRIFYLPDLQNKEDCGRKENFGQCPIKMAYEVIILCHLHRLLYFIGIFTEYPYNKTLPGTDYHLPHATKVLSNLVLHIPADTRSAFPVISVQSPVSIQCCWQS